MKKLLVVMTVMAIGFLLAVPAFAAEPKDKLIVMDAGGTVKEFVVNDAGQVSIGTGASPTADVDIVAPNNGLILLGSSAADATTKAGRMVLRHFTNAQLPVYLFGAASTPSNNFVAFGGGATIGNAATQLDFYTGANITTPMGTSRMTIKSDGRVGVGTTSPSHLFSVGPNGAGSDGSTWFTSSSREYKDNIQELSAEKAIETVKNMNPVTFVYKDIPGYQHVGFIAEDVPNLVATPDRKTLSTMDIVAVLTKVVQEQEKTIAELSAKLNKLESQVTRIKAKDVFGIAEGLRSSAN